VLQDGPASSGGIRPGDVVTRIGGKAVANTAELLNVVASLPPGSEAPVGVQRGDKALDVTVRVAQRPARQAVR
jgi:serine protease DegQ